jgi:hypothetical protein
VPSVTGPVRRLGSILAPTIRLAAFSATARFASATAWVVRPEARQRQRAGQCATTGTVLAHRKAEAREASQVFQACLRQVLAERVATAAASSRILSRSARSHSSKEGSSRASPASGSPR